MKKHLQFSVIALLLLLSGVYSKSYAVIDSVYADSIIYSLSVTNEINIKGKPDNLFAKFEVSGELALAFKSRTGIIPIKNKAVVQIWGRKDIEVDSSAGYVVFVHTSSDGTILYQTAPFILHDGPNNIITAPDSLYTYLQFGLPGDITGGAKSFYIDAVMLKEDTSSVTGAVHSAADLSHSAIIANYPNPFTANTTLVITLDKVAHVGVIVTDALGREVRNLALGSVASGESRIPLSIEAPGFYAARLVIDGIPQQKIYKLTAK